LLAPPVLPQASAQAEEPRYGGTIIRGLFANPTTLVTVYDLSGANQEVSRVCFNQLIHYNEYNEPEPELAESWEWSPDKTEMTFHLVKNAQFHDGTPLTSEDAKFGYEQALTYHGRFNQMAVHVDSIETPDDHTMVVKFKYPYISFPMLLDNSNGALVLPKHIYEVKAGENPLLLDAQRSPIGSGPFKFVEWVPGSHVTYERNENYWKKDEAGRPLPYLDKVVFKIMTDPVTRILALEKGEIDAVSGSNNLPLTEVERLQKNPDVVIGVSPTIGDVPKNFFGGSNYIIGLNVREAPLDDVRVRKALAHATDRQLILDKAYGGYPPLGVSPVPRDALFHNPNVKQPDYDPAKANELLDEAGYKRGADEMRFSINIVYDGGQGAFAKAAEIARENFKDVGVDLKLVPLERGAFIDRVYRNWDFDTFLQSFASGPDPDVAAGRWVTGYAISKKRTFNNAMGYNNSEVDRLWLAAAKEGDPEKKKELYWKAQEIIVNEQHVILYGESVNPWAHRKEFKNVIKESSLSSLSHETTYWVEGRPAGEVAPVVVEEVPYMLYIGVAVVLIAAVAAGAFYYRRRSRS
jgi:peptide/nickel transport system substrate-binding protein